MINWFNTVKRYYDMGFYTVNDVNKFVVWGKITEEEATLIHGQAYVYPTF